MSFENVPSLGQEFMGDITQLHHKPSFKKHLKAYKTVHLKLQDNKAV